MVTRRAFTKAAALAAGATVLPEPAAFAAASTPRIVRGWESLDEALGMIEGRGAEYGPHLANHGPMAAEALCALGRGDRAPAWVASYRTRLDDAAPARERVTEETWRAAVGDVSRVTDWARFFEARLEE